MFEQFFTLIKNTKKPKIDAIAVTKGPGLEPALWVGINFAKALSSVWDIPLFPINHMEGHIVASLLKSKNKSQKIKNIKFSAVALLVSGGHTELVLIKNWFAYKILGKTRDDAAGEAYDKVARMLGLPYPGGPHISRIAETIPDKSSRFPLPRPMLNSDNFDFSFSGLKTAVLYTIKKIPRLTPKMKAEIANEFENAVIEVLLKKTLLAAQTYKAKTIILGGGVSANTRLRKYFISIAKENNVELLLPQPSLSTDNALMIAIAAYYRTIQGNKKNKLITTKQKNSLTARGALTL